MNGLDVRWTVIAGSGPKLPESPAQRGFRVLDADAKPRLTGSSNAVDRLRQAGSVPSMNFKKLAEQAKKQADKVVEQRGGSANLKKDASQVADALKGKGKLSEKAKKAAEAVKKPG